ncbi:MAG: hypothetical protein ACYDAE_17220 [Steroidobacteraceae bacterium]
MKRKPAHKPRHADSGEYQRFVDTAREVGADESPEAFERAFKRVAEKPSPQKPAPRRTRRK